MGQRKRRKNWGGMDSLLLQNKQYEDLKHFMKDYDFQKQLMRKYRIIDN